jgi:hypothetical protein
MKMKQKGIATAVIAVVVIVVIAVAGVGAFLVLRGRAPAGVGGLPVYGGATKSDTVAGMGTSSNFVKGTLGKGQDVPADVQAEVYTATGSVADILNYYRTEMGNAGWTKKYDNTFSYDFMDMSMTIGLLYFEKGDRAAAVYAASFTYQGETYLYFGLVEGPKTVFDTWMSGAGYEWEEEEVTPGGGVSGATSLDFKIDMTAAGQTTTMRFRARNIGTANMDIRYDMAEMSYILSGSQQQGWVYAAGQWMSFSDMGLNFSEYWDTTSSSFEEYTGQLSEWTSGEWTYSYGGYTIRIYDIQVNPTLGDEVFTPS